MSQDPQGHLVLKQVGSRESFFLDGRMVRKGATLEISNGVGGWIKGRFEWSPLSTKPPTLLCAQISAHDPSTQILNVVEISGDAYLRWPQ